MSHYKTYECTVTPQDIMRVETSFDDGDRLGFESYQANGQQAIICLHVDQIKQLIKQLQKAVKDTGK
jgi:hypothetical protein